MSDATIAVAARDTAVAASSTAADAADGAAESVAVALTHRNAAQTARTGAEAARDDAQDAASTAAADALAAVTPANDVSMTAVDNNAASAFRVQQDARLSATIGTAAARKVSLVVAATGGDYSTITAAIAAVPAGGADILVKRGTYTLTSTVNLPDNTTLRGEGTDATIIKAANSLNANVVQVPTGCDDVTIRDLTVDGNRANQGANSNAIITVGARTTVLNCHVKSANGYNIVAFPGATDFRVIGCISEDARDEGIEFQGVVRGLAQGNTVRGIGKNGIYVYANTASNSSNVCTDITITGNVVEGSAALTSGYAGIRVDDRAQNVTVTGNVVKGGGTSAVGISVFSSTAYIVKHVTVTGNAVSDTPSTGIYVDGVEHVTVSANDVHGAGSNGINLNTCKYVTAVGNTVRAAATNECIRAFNGTDVTIQGNVASHATTGYGIRCQGNTGLSVVGNASYANALSGILLSSNTSAAINGNTVRGNTQHGIEVSGATGGSISNNTLSLNGGINYNGIFVYGASKGVAIAGNHVAASGRVGIRVEDSTDCTITGNVARNNGQGGNTTWYVGILLYKNAGTCSGHIVTGNRCYDDQGTKTQGWGIKVLGACDNLVLGPNLSSGNSAGAQTVDGTATNVLGVTPV